MNRNTFIANMHPIWCRCYYRFILSIRFYFHVIHTKVATQIWRDFLFHLLLIFEHLLNMLTNWHTDTFIHWAKMHHHQFWCCPQFCLSLSQYLWRVSCMQLARFRCIYNHAKICKVQKLIILYKWHRIDKHTHTHTNVMLCYGIAFEYVQY